jgi:probable F420-dependent oxidoreductase
MEFGVILPNSGSLGSADAMYAIAECAEELGFSALWTSDHLVVPVESSASYPYVRDVDVKLNPDHGFIEPLIALAGVAARTRHIRLGVSVYLAALRHPLVAAKSVASLDQLSGGRVLLGVGAGWIPEEYETLGIEWSERGAVLDEHIACMRELWSESRPSYQGRHFQFRDIGFEPKPVAGDVPIWVGGNSRPAMRRAARLGNGWHGIDMPADELEAKLLDLEKMCAEHDRSLGDLTISMRSQLAITEAHVPPAERVAPLTGTPDELIADLIALRTLGMDHIAVWPATREIDLDAYLRHMERVAREILPALAD